MKKTNATKLFGNGNLKRIFALLIVMLMLTLSACQTSETDNTSSDASTPSSQTTPSDVASDSTEETEEDKTEDSSFTVGNLAIEGEKSSNKIPSDANEIEPIVDPTNRITNYKGYAEKERNKLLNEILNTPNTLELYDVKGEVYYVSTSGNDANDGLTPETAIRTLSAIDGLPLEDGDAVLFERGCIWRMTEKFDCRSNVTYGSYGEGRKPMFLGSPKNFAQEVWKPSKKKNVWQITYMYNYPCGAFFDQGKEAGYLKTTMRAMTANTHFFYDESVATLYLYCDKGNPSDVWDSIEFSQANIRFTLGTGGHGTVIDNLAIRYTGQGGVGCSYAGHDFTITNCEMGFTGGAWVGGDPSSGLRYCNAIESWCGGSGFEWNHNWIYETFDTAISPQGNIGTLDYKDISMNNNLLEFNNADFEFFEAQPAKYINYNMNNNICRFTSLGWGTREDDGGIRGIDGVQRGTIHENQIQSISFSNNIIDCPGRMIYKFEIPTKKDYDNWKRENNVYYIKQSIRTTDALTFKFCWTDESTRISGHSASDEKATLAAFKEFEPSAKVYWYK